MYLATRYLRPLLLQAGSFPPTESPSEILSKAKLVAVDHKRATDAILPSKVEVPFQLQVQTVTVERSVVVVVVERSVATVFLQPKQFPLLSVSRSVDLLHWHLLVLLTRKLPRIVWVQLPHILLVISRLSTLMFLTLIAMIFSV